MNNSLTSSTLQQRLATNKSLDADEEGGAQKYLAPLGARYTSSKGMPKRWSSLDRRDEMQSVQEERIGSMQTFLAQKQKCESEAPLHICDSGEKTTRSIGRGS